MARPASKGLKRAGEIALRRAHVADPLVADGEVALPFRVARIGGGEALADGKAGLKGLKRAGEIALRRAHVADPLMAYGEVALPFRVARIGGGKALADGKAGLKAFKRAGEIALRHAHVADLVMADGEVALAIWVIGRSRRAPLGNAFDFGIVRLATDERTEPLFDQPQRLMGNGAIAVVVLALG